jgi:hypothetical protein
VYTEEQQRYVNDVQGLSKALWAAMESWMAREEKRPADAAVVLGATDFAARVVLRGLRDKPPERREDLDGRLAGDADRPPADRRRRGCLA